MRADTGTWSARRLARTNVLGAYTSSMKRKMSVTLSEDVLSDLAHYAGSGQSRSAYIEHVLRGHFRRRARAAEQARDVQRINAAADQLNAEMAEVLEFQAAWPDEDQG